MNGVRVKTDRLTVAAIYGRKYEVSIHDMLEMIEALQCTLNVFCMYARVASAG